MGTKVLTDFGSAGRVLVSTIDYYAEKHHTWRLDSFGYVVRTGETGSKSRVTLAREVARRAGYGDGSVRYRDGDRLNCTRANLYVKGAHAVRVLPGGPGRNHGGLLQPRGVHRRAQTQDGVNGGLPPGWVITYHTGPCKFPEGIARGCHLSRPPDAVIIGTATRLPLETRIRTRWEFAGSGQSAEPASFFEGCMLLRNAYLKSLVPAGTEPGPGLALMYELLGIGRPA